MVDVIQYLAIRLQDEKLSLLESENLVQKYKKAIVFFRYSESSPGLLLCRKNINSCYLMMSTLRR